MLLRTRSYLRKIGGQDMNGKEILLHPHLFPFSWTEAGAQGTYQERARARVKVVAYARELI